MDLSAEFVAEARSAAQAQALEVEFVRSDMKCLAAPAEFDGAFCFGNSFAYLEHHDVQTFVAGVARALKPGGQFVVQTGMAAESILPNLKAREWYQVGDIFFAIMNSYLAEASCLETAAVFVRDGKTETRQCWHWVYTVRELRRLFEEAGFEVTGLFASLDRQPFRLGAEQLLVVARKPGDHICLAANR